MENDRKTPAVISSGGTLNQKIYPQTAAEGPYLERSERLKKSVCSTNNLFFGGQDSLSQPLAWL